ncbi:MAG: hypothetical protein HY591_05440 [Candidatus Omnitrophica bacterium]|nr:hypothetical protein [Candidatus Omnitrophota bacterium]
MFNLSIYAKTPGLWYNRYLMLKRFLFLLIVFSLLPLAARAETITYDIKKWGMKVGQAALTFGGEVDFEGRHLALIVFKADGFNFYDEEKIYTEPGTFRPVVVLRDFDLNVFGKGKIREEYLTGEGKIKVIKESGGKKEEQVLQKQGPVDNIYGFIQRYRKEGSFKIGDVLDLHLPTKDLKIKMMRQLKLTISGKIFDAFYMHSIPAQYQIWFDAGPGKLPLKISGAIGLANTVMVMTGHSPSEAPSSH